MGGSTHISVHHSKIEEYLSEIDKQNNLFDTWADTEYRIQLKNKYIRTTRNIYGQYNEYELSLEYPSEQAYKFILLKSDGLVTVNPEFKKEFEKIGEQMLLDEYKCNRCGRPLKKNVFVCMNLKGEYEYFGGSCIDVVYPNYKYMSQLYRHFSDFVSKYNCTDLFSLPSGGTPVYWFHDTLLVFSYLYDRIKHNPNYNVKEDTNLLDWEYPRKKELPELTDEISKEYNNMLLWYIEKEIPTNNDFLFNLYTIAKRNFQINMYITSNGMCKWIVAEYLKQIFKPKEHIEIINPYNVGDKIKILCNVIEFEKYEEPSYTGYGSQLMYSIKFKSSEGYLFYTNTTKVHDIKVGDTVIISGTIKYISGKKQKYNKISRCKIEKQEPIEEL